MREETQVVEVTDVRQGPEGAAELERIPASRLPASVLGLFQAGMERLNQGEAGAAAACFEEALRLAPEFADGHVGLGIAYALDSRIYPALDHLEDALELEPENFYAHFKLGQLYFKLRVPQKGYEQMSLALKCATSVEERKLVAQLLREERQREKNDYARPWWNKPFSRIGVALGAGVVFTLLTALLLHLR